MYFLKNNKNIPKERQQRLFNNYYLSKFSEKYNIKLPSNYYEKINTVSNYYYNNIIKNIYETNKLLNKKIPKIIMITCKNKQHIPKIQYKRVKSLYPDYDILFYSDKLAGLYLRDNFGESIKLNFDLIPDGPIKSDYFRCFWLLSGGIYFDSDIYFLSKIELNDHTIIIPNSSNQIEMNPEIVCVCPNHPFIISCINEYNFVIENIPYSYWDWSIVTIFSRIHFILPDSKKKEDLLFEHRHYIFDINRKLICKNRLTNIKNHKLVTNSSIKIYIELIILYIFKITIDLMNKFNYFLDYGF